MAIWYHAYPTYSKIVDTSIQSIGDVNCEHVKGIGSTICDYMAVRIPSILVCRI